LSHTRPTRLRDAPGRETSNDRVRRTIRGALEAGRVRIEEIVWAVSAPLTGRATRSLTLLPVRVSDGSATYVRRPAPGGCSSVWVVSPSATHERQG
jgi:hypothetical protein